MKKTLKDDKYWRYRAKCKNCSEVIDWVVGKENGVWHSFYKIIVMNKFPFFTSRCESCENESVFELLAMSARPDVEE